MLDTWEVSTLDAAGFNPESIIEATNRIRNQDYKNIHSLLIVRNRTLVYEEYFAGIDGHKGFVEFDKNKLHDLRSVSKSVASALIGIAIDRGYIESVDVPIFQFFPEYADHRTDEKNRITLKHLLAMTAGFEWDQSGAHQSEPDSLNSEAQMENSADFIEYVLSKEMSDEPGERFNYNSGCTILLAGVIKNVSGMHADQFAEKYLFRPLGINRHDWYRTANGLPQTHAGLLLRPRDMAKIGQLYLDQGRWKDQQIFPASWVSESTKPHSKNEGYGFGWWLDSFSVQGRTLKGYVAAGNGGQFIFVIPDIHMVIVFSGGNYGSSIANQAFKIVNEYVLPSVNKSSLKMDPLMPSSPR
jgi:CubicO group peptidase (beta-lactamase class C family)